MSTRRRAALLGTLLLALSAAGPAAAWPPTLQEVILRDARRLLPRSLALALAKRELEVRAHVRALFAVGLSADLYEGRLSPATLSVMETQRGEMLDLFRQRHIHEGLLRLGGLARLPLDLSDPALAADESQLPARVRDEYYQFIAVNLDKIPVVVADRRALELGRAELPAYWQGLLDESRAQAPVIAAEMVKNGRLVSYRAIDFRSPVFGVASLSYSRAVTAVAATWLAVWRETRGDLTRRPKPADISPQAPAAAPTASQRPNPERSNP